MELKQINFHTENCENIIIKSKNIIELTIDNIKKERSLYSKRMRTLAEDITIKMIKNNDTLSAARSDITYITLVFKNKEDLSFQIPWYEEGLCYDSSNQKIKSDDKVIVWQNRSKE